MRRSPSLRASRASRFLVIAGCATVAVTPPGRHHVRMTDERTAVDLQGMLAPAIGLRVAKARLGIGSALLLDRDSPERWSVLLTCDWRLETDIAMLAGSDDDLTDLRERGGHPDRPHAGGRDGDRCVARPHPRVRRRVALAHLRHRP